VARRGVGTTALNGTLAQPNRVALALLRKFDDALGHERRHTISAVYEPQLS
jgi:hypothetical protein